mgnify:CR=1 FL=1
MIEILESPKHLIAMKISGSVTAEDIEEAYKTTNEVLKSNERVSFFAEVDGSTGFTIEGAIKDLWNGIGQIGNLSKYYRAAVVTDKGWLAAMARVEGLVFSSIDVRVFEPRERAKAFAWAAEAPEPLSKPEVPHPSIYFIQTTSENVFAYEVNGRLREKDVKNAVEAFMPFLEKDQNINVLARLKNFNGFDLTALLDDDLVKMKYKAITKVERYAVIGAKPWMRNLIELFSPMFSTEIRFFDPEDEDAAWVWVGASQALLAEKSA